MLGEFAELLSQIQHFTSEEKGLVFALVVVVILRTLGAVFPVLRNPKDALSHVLLKGLNGLIVLLVVLLLLFKFFPLFEQKLAGDDLSGDAASLSVNYRNAVSMIDCLFYDGGDESQYFIKSEALLRKLSEQGYSEAQFCLGYMLDPKHTKIKEKCAAIQQDAKFARDLYRGAASQGHSTAQYYLANIYFEEKDYPHATEWYKISADSGNVNAQYALGYMCGIGYAVGEIDASSYGAAFNEGFRIGRAER